MFKIDSNKGFIYIHRQIEDSKLWEFKPFSKGQAWIDLLLCTNHKSGFITTKNGTVIDLERGDCGYSVVALADRWGWSRGKVNRYLDWLSTNKMIQQKIVSNHTIIKVINYDNYQNKTVNSTINDTINGQQTEQQTDTNNNVNNENNILNNKESENLKKITDPNYSPEMRKFLDSFKRECKKHTALSPDERIKLMNILNDLMFNEGFSLDEIIKTVCKNFNNLNFDKGKINVGINWLLKDSNFYSVLNGQNTKLTETQESKKECDGWTL